MSVETIKYSSIDEELNKKIKFIEFQYPSLRMGEYKITLEQTVKGNIEGSSVKLERKFSTKKRIIVRGERFSIKAETIHSVFPQENTQGNYHNCLPHIVFNKSTFPWQRVAKDKENNSTRRYPWLALIVLTAKRKSWGLAPVMDSDIIVEINSAVKLWNYKGIATTYFE